MPKGENCLKNYTSHVKLKHGCWLHSRSISFCNSFDMKRVFNLLGISLTVLLLETSKKVQNFKMKNETFLCNNFHKVIGINCVLKMSVVEC